MMGNGDSVPGSSSSTNDNNSGTNVPSTESQDQLGQRNRSEVKLVVISQPVLDLIANADVPIELFGNGDKENKDPNSVGLRRARSPFENSQDGQARPGIPRPGNGGFNFYPGGPYGGPPGGIQPDTVPASFKLEAIGGLDEQIKYLKRSIILPLVNPAVLQSWGVDPPKGILLHGPPGTGKTFMAKAIVNELKKHLKKPVNFFYRKGGDVFSMWFGESQRKLREVFSTAKQKHPSVIFFDEIDGLCPSREDKNHGTDAYNSVVTCFLGQMDALENGKVFVIAATNRLDAVDPAVRRPGRFDKHLAFGFPDEEARAKIIEIHTSKWSREVRPDEARRKMVAGRTVGFSGADLEKLCKDVVYTAIEENKGNATNAMEIEEKHWLKAISSMQRTASDSFGSALFIPTKPNGTVSLLIKPVVDTVINRITPLMSERSLAESSSTVFKSFVLTTVPGQSKAFVNAQIAQAILCAPLFAKCSMFELSAPKILNKVLNHQAVTIAAALQNVVNQARDAAVENPTVVYAPNLNEVLAICKGNQMLESTFFNLITKIRGPKLLLLATSSVPINEIQELGFTEIFHNRHMHVQNPKQEQLREFFKTMLEQNYPNNMVETLDKVAKDAAVVGDNHSFDDILNLWEDLQGIRMEAGLTEDAVQQEFTKVLNNFRDTKH